MMSRKTLICLLIALPCLGVGGWLIVDYRQSIPPDLATAEPADLTAFMLSSHFNDLSLEQRKKYIEMAMKRYATMTEAQRKVVDEMVGKMRKDNPEQLREQAMKIWKGFVVVEAEQYVHLPLEKRKEWIKAKANQWKGMMGNGPGGKQADAERQRRREQREKQNRGPLTPERQAKIVGFFQTEVYPRSTARERALIMTLMKDAAPLMRPKDNKR